MKKDPVNALTNKAKEEKAKRDISYIIGKTASKTYADKLYDEKRQWALAKSQEAEDRARQRRVEQLKRMGML